VIRTVVKIAPARCNGCGLCVRACHEGALGLVDGVATLLRDDYCDGMGDCLPACPMDAIAFEEREAAAYDEAAVAAATAARKPASETPAAPGPARAQEPAGGPLAGGAGTPVFLAGFEVAGGPASQLAQWPCQIKLVPVQAPYFEGADLLVAADCTAFACADFHARYMAGRVTVVGCPKLDGVDYAQKLGAILAANDVRGVTVLRMDVPCCGGLQRAAETAVAMCGKTLPLRVVTLGRDGRELAR